MDYLIEESKRRLRKAWSALLQPTIHTGKNIDIKDYEDPCVCGRKTKDKNTFDRMDRGGVDR